MGEKFHVQSPTSQPSNWVRELGYLAHGPVYVWATFSVPDASSYEGVRQVHI